MSYEASESVPRSRVQGSVSRYYKKKINVEKAGGAKGGLVSGIRRKRGDREANKVQHSIFSLLFIYYNFF